MKVIRRIPLSLSTTFAFPAPVKLTPITQTAYAIWNTTAGKNSRSASAGASIGQFISGEIARNVFDGNTTTTYASYGGCSDSVDPRLDCGEGTGLYLSLSRGAALLVAFRICAASSCLNCDPITVTIEGSNRPSSALTYGSSWTSIYNGSSGLDVDPGASHFGVIQWLEDSSLWYSSYRLLVISKRDIGKFVHYSELELFGYW